MNIRQRIRTASDRELEDFIFAARTEKAWREYEKGNFKELSGKEFLRALKKW
jgi:hypothetical protein